MKLTFYPGSNFGDRLNEFLLPQVFPNFFDDDASTLFLGIGSILFDTYPHSSQKLVFGSGFAKYTAAPKIDDHWKLYCLRGPRTASALGVSGDLVAADSAILIKNFVRRDPEPKVRCSFIPHFESLKFGRWVEVARDVGVNLIDPRWPVEKVLRQITASELVITEAMHGAIVADALRVPWVPFTPLNPIHRFKWHDWAEALNIHLRPNVLAPSSAEESLILGYGTNKTRWLRGGIRMSRATTILDLPFRNGARESLRSAMLMEPSLSTDHSLDRALDKLQSAAALIKRDFSL